MDIRYRIEGGHCLRGDVKISGSKNAVLPLIAASLLCNGQTVLKNVPDIRDVRSMLNTLEYLGAECSFEKGTVSINTSKIRSRPIPHEYVCKLRASILLLGPLLARFGVVEMSYPGGCVLGKRPVGAHIAALEQLGVEDMSTDEVLHLQGNLKPGHVILPEFSVTATENVLMAAALLPGETRIELAAAEPHVQEVEKALQKMGVKINGIGSHTVFITGNKNLNPIEHTVTFDYLEAGLMVVAALITNGKITLQDIDNEQLHCFLQTVSRLGGNWKYSPDNKTLVIDGDSSRLKSLEVRTNIFPGFPTDLQAPLGVAMTQAEGVSRLFERLFEGRLAYLYELEKMGAHVEILNSHQALIIGPTPLKGKVVASNDIRAGAAMVLAALCAEGETTITDVRYIERGYDRLEEKLNKLGAKIEKIELERKEED